MLVSNRAGKRVRKRVSAATKTELQERLKELQDELGQGVVSSATYTVNKAVDDWLATLADKSEQTVTTQRYLLDPLMTEIGKTVLRDLQADDVMSGLKAIGATRTSRTVRDTKASLVRAITYAQARNLVGRNVASLISAPPGKAPGRPARSLTVAHALKLLKAAEDNRLNAYVVLSLLVGVRTEEARALRWEHVDLDSDPPTVAVWRSVRASGETKTRKSRRTLALPERAVAALNTHQKLQARERDIAAELWQETGLVFTTTVGTPLDAANVRRAFKKICENARIGRDWTPRDLRHSFVSIMSDSGVPIERIADLLGHAGGSRVTEEVYRHQIRPVLIEGAEVMDDLLKPRGRRVVRRKPKAPEAGEPPQGPSESGGH